MKKVLIKRIASIFLIAIMLITILPLNVLAEELVKDNGQNQALPESFGDNLERLVENEKVEFVKNGFTFRVETDAQDGKPGTAEIIYFLDEREPTDVNYGVIVIPETVNYLGYDYRVEAVKSDAFDETLIIKALVMPDSITNVGEGLFEEKGRFTLYCNSGSFIEQYLQEKKFGWVTVVTDGIKANPDKNVLKPDETAKARLVHALSFLQDQAIQWESSAPALASIDQSGTITGISPGVSSITGKLAGLKASFDCTIKADEPAPEINTQRSVQSNSAQILTANEADGDFVIENGVLTKYLGNASEVVIPEEVTVIGAEVFRNNQTITHVSFPSGLVKIGYSAFLNCSLKDKLTLPDSLTEIESFAFADCSGLTGDLVIPSKMKQINYGTFQNCINLDGNLFLPDQLEKIGMNAFMDCSKLKGTLSLPQSLTTIDAQAFYRCSGFSGDLIIPDRVEILGGGAFQNCSGFDGSLKLSDNLTEISVGAFLNCTRFKGTLNIPDKVTSISSFSFSACSGVTDIVLGSSVAVVAQESFTNCKGIKSINFESEIPPVISDVNAFFDGMPNLETVYCPSTTAYEVVCQDYCAENNVEFSIAEPVEDTRPDQITNLVAFGDTNQVVLSWTIAHEISTDKYRLYRKAPDDQQFVPVMTIEGRCTLTYTDNQVETDTRYEYYIVGVNNYNQESIPSKTIAVTSKQDLESPQITQLTPSSGIVLGGETELYARAIDNVAVTKIALYLSEDNGVNWRKISESEGSYCRYQLNTQEITAASILVKALAYDAAGNESDSFVNAYQIDNIAPQKVTGLSYESTATTAVIHWTDVADNDLAGFKLERQNLDGSFSLVQDITNTLGANVSGLSPDSAYVYRVAAYDRLGNIGIYSDPLTILTVADLIPPVITKILPGPGYYVNQIPLRITAEDNANLEKVAIQISRDAINWQSQTEISASGNSITETVDYSLDITSLEEGNLFVRGIAVDRSGNQGNSSSEAPYVQYVIDRAAPSVPQNVRVSVNTGAIEVAWGMGTEADLGNYVLYRSLEAENFVAIADNLQTLNYWDRNIEKEKTYFYCVAVKDHAGNESEKSTVVSAQMMTDTEAPVIESVYPADGSSIGAGNNVFRAVVSDNWKLQSVNVTYTINNEAEKSVLAQTDNVDNYYKRINCNLPMNKFKNGDTLHLMIEAEDAFGLRVSQELTYFVDLLAPVVKNVSVDEGSDALTLTWSGDNEPDLAGFRIFRKADEQSYKLVGQRSVQNGASLYSFIDPSVELNQVYTYKIEAVDKNGNSRNMETRSVWLQGVPQVEATLKCDRQQEVNVEYQIDGSDSFADLGIATYEFDFGDGEIKTQSSAKIIHHYQNTGNYTIRLKVTDKNGETAETSCDISVLEPQLLGTVLVKTVDVAGNPISGIPVYFDIDNTEGNIKQSNASGQAVFTSKAEKRSIGAYADGYLPVKKSLIVRAGTQTELIVTMIKQPIVTGQFEINRMTLDEIKAAGIDVSNPANQQVMKVRIFLQYGSQPLEMSVISNGGNTNINNTIIVDTDAGQRKVTATVVKMNSSNGTGAGSSGGDGSSGGSGNNDDNIIIALMDVPVEASFLKEFFDVKLHLINHAAQEFNLSHNQITLNVPNGMSIVKTTERPNAEVVTFDQFAGQEEKTIDWVLRGDQAGEYDLTANYSSILDQFNQPVEAEFKTAEPIKVYGVTGVKLIAEINSTIRDDALYFNLGLENKNGVDLSLPAIDVTESLIRQFEISNNYREKAVTVELLNSTLHNSSGFQQFLGTGQIPDILHVGETYTKKYVAYNAIEYDDVAYLQKTIEAFAKEQGFEVEIRKSQLDLFDLSLAKDKTDPIFYNGDQTNFDVYTRIMDNNEFLYMIQAVKANDDLLGKFGENIHGAAEFVLTLDFEIFTNDELKEITRNTICDLLADESFAEVVDYSIDDSYIKITKSTLGLLSGKLKERKCDESVITAINNSLSNESAIRKLAGDLKNGGEDAFYQRLTTLVTSGAGAALSDLTLRSLYENNELAEMIGDSVSQECSSAKKVIGAIGEVVEDWNKSAELTRQMIMLNACYSESLFLLDAILASETLNAIVKEEVQEMKSELEGAYTSQIDNFIQELAKTVAEEGIKWGIETAIKCVDAAFGLSLGAVKVIISSLFSVCDYLFDWSGQVSSLKRNRVCGTLTFALKDSVIAHFAVEGEEIQFLRALKYLIKLRLVGEKDYVESANKYSKETVLKAINATRQENKYQSLDDYYDDFSNRLLSERDMLFNKAYTIATIPVAPEVSIDYENEYTDESFGLDYEYSFDGVNWEMCMLQPIKLEPVMVSRYLWVRKKASILNPAGNITKIIVPSRNWLRDDIAVTYQDGTYLVSGLPDGSYAYLATDDGSLGLNENAQRLDVTNNSATIKLPFKSYLILRKDSADRSFASQIKAYRVEKVVQSKVEKITVIQQPKTVYRIGEDLDVNNGKIKIFYDDGTEEVEPLTKAMCGNFNSRVLGKQKIEVTYKEKSTFYEVLVNSGEQVEPPPDTKPEPEIPEKPDPGMPDPSTPDPPEPGANSPIDEKKAIEAIEKAGEGTTVTIKVGEKESIPVGLLEAAKGKNMAIVFDYGDYTWEISGTSITDVQEGLDAYDLSVKSIKNKTLTDLINDSDAIQFEISHNGPFPFIGRLTYKVNSSFNGKTVTLYYYNETAGKLEYQNQSTVSNGSVSFEFGHASMYVISAAVKPEEPEINCTYQTQLENIGWQGFKKNGEISGTVNKSLRLEGIEVKTDQSEKLGITYQTHVQNIGWQGFKSNGEMSGTSGKGLRLEAIQIKLTGSEANQYDVYYQVYTEKFGWLDWAKNGESAGSEGFGYRLEAIKIQILKKGSRSPGAMENPFKKNVQCVYQTHVQNVGWQGFRSNGEMSGTAGQALRLEGIEIKFKDVKELGVQYSTHVENLGWQNEVKDGAMSGTTGQGLRLEAIRISLTGEDANKYDIYYQVHAQNFGWLDWAKNGDSAGTAGFGYRLEAIKIIVVPKGASGPGEAIRPFVENNDLMQ